MDTDTLQKYLNNGYIFIISVFVFYSIYIDTVFNNNYFQLHSNIIFISIILFSLLKIFFNNHTNLGIICITLMILLSFIISFLSNDLLVATEICLIIAAKNVNFKKIIRYYFYIGLITTIIPIILSLFHIIPNYTFPRGDGMVRYSFGFSYPTGLSEIICILCVSYCILNYKKISYIRIVVFILITYFIIHYVITKMDYYCMLLLLVIVVLQKLYPKLLNKFPFTISWTSLPIMSIITFYIANKFNLLSTFYRSMDKFFEGRIMYSNMALKNDGISILGQQIYENADNLKSNNMMYFFIDQSMIRMAVKYGIILLLIFLLVYTYKMFRLYRLNINYLVLLFMVLVIRGFVDPNVINIVGDPFLLILLSNIDDFIPDIKKYKFVHKRNDLF